VCEVCGKGFVRSDDLRVHRIVHTKERRFMCDECGKSFAKSILLKAHKRSHTTTE